MLAIIADDLTGALDAAAPFATRGMHSEVALTVDAIEEAIREKPDVLSVNLGSRELSAELAQRLTKDALSVLPPETRIFKKIDSRLKGPIAQELDVMSFRLALVAPAIPDFGRIVKAGAVEGFGVRTPISVAEKLGRHAACALVPDTSTQGQMRAALADAERAGVDLLVGARGLAEAFAEHLGGEAPAQAAEIPAGPVLLVIGSRDPITLAQIDALRDDFEPRYLPAPNGRLDGARPDGSTITLVQAVPGGEVVASEDVSNALAEGVCPDFTEMASTLVLSGGATAQAVLQRMGITHFRLRGECLPGLGLAYAQRHCIITKSGGFGQPDTLREIANRILRKTG
jgi:uncharacterized protein YgbK (DUF1537 family)